MFFDLSRDIDVRWNFGLPESWAETMGLVAVPMFGAERQQAHEGRSAILLDGDSASAAISIAASSALPASADALSWAWSSNVTHSLLVDAERRVVEWRRWDRPGELRTFPIPSRNVSARLSSLLKGPLPNRSATVITKAVNLFRAIREQVAKAGGSPVDAIAAFNRLLFWAATDAAALSDLRQRLQLQKRLNDLPSPPAGSLIPTSVALVDIGTTLADFFAFDPETHLVLDPDLLLRHASGSLFQEAHRVIDRDDQTWLFPAAKSVQKGPLKRKDIHFTPPSLARLLTDEAMMAMSVQRTRPSPMIVADPACGSGEFLLEAAHYSTLDGPLLLHGMDNSPESCEMARFALWWAAGNESLVIETDSLLEDTEWRTPNVVLMNPPFTSWEEMDDKQKAAVDKTLGDYRHGRPDLSLAFLLRALAEVQPDGVVASILPASFLDSDFAAKVRREIASNNKFHVHLIGHFKDLGYFREATVEPAFVVIQKSRTPDIAKTETLFLESDQGYADDAIRGLRRFRHGADPQASGWRLFRDRLAGGEASWKPSARRQSPSRAEVNGLKTVGELFQVRLGARVGGKKALMIKRQEFSDLPSGERGLFMPVADKIKDGRIVRSDYVFFPYDNRGAPLIPDESTLSELVPVFLDRKLNPARPALEARRSHGKPWWFLARPRGWQKWHLPRLVSKAFGRMGDFAFDDEGRYAVVQGLAWFWKRDPGALSILGYAYLALLNSPYFDGLLAEFCPRVRGGQFNLSRKYIARVPLPDLSSPPESAIFVEGLSVLGRQMSDGAAFDAGHLEAMARAVYGAPVMVRAGAADAATVARFIFLAHQCVEATQHCSRSDQIARHPSHKAIVAMGDEVIGLLLNDLKRSGGYWFGALHEITNENPVLASDRGNVQKMIEAWLNWGKRHGHIPQK